MRDRKGVDLEGAEAGRNWEEERKQKLYSGYIK